MKVTIQIATQISQCCKTWDELLSSTHHLQSRHLQSFENAAMDDIENNYVQVFLNNQLIGLLYLQQFRFQHKHFNFKKESSIQSRIVDIFLPSDLPLLICGHLFRINYPGYYFKDPAHQSLLFDALDLYTQQNKNYKPCGIMIKDSNQLFTEQRCRFWGYHFFGGDVTMEISRRLHWLSFDDYLKDLKKDYFKRAKKILHAFENIETRELNAAEIFAQAVVLEKLYLNVVSKQTIRLGTVSVRYFYELKIDLKENFEFYGLYHQGILVGFYTFIFYKNNMETHYIGLDYEANKTFKLYFNILFLAVKKMIERGVNKVELGRTAREAKSNLGALPKQIFNFIKVSNPVIKIIINYFLKSFNRSESQSLFNRNPLK